jgi:anti-sigma regulatory factor (Ser/Thr protein kinase)
VTDVLHRNLQQHFYVPGPSGAGGLEFCPLEQQRPRPRPLLLHPARESAMSTATSARRAELHAWRARMPANQTTPSEARGHVRAAICAWQIPVDPDIAVLLTSELVTNAITATPGADITLSVRCNHKRLRVEVHDTTPSMPAPADGPADAEAGRGLILVDTLSTEWGFYRTPAGKAVYFTLAFPPGPLSDRQVRLLAIVDEGGGNWDARRIDLTASARYGPGEGTVLQELEALQQLGLIARDDSRSGVGGRWKVTAAAPPQIP